MKQAGFTFIELLVVTTIILLLSAAALVSYQSAQRRARDNKRQADLEQFRSALEMIRSDLGCYPYADGGSCQQCIPPSSGTWSCNGVTYMKAVPQDPTPNRRYYYHSNNGSDYSLCAAMELTQDESGSCSGGNCGNAACNYQVGAP